MSQCLTCGQELKLIPAGISQTTGKSYNAFVACPNRCPQPKAPQALAYQPNNQTPYYAPLPTNNAPTANYRPNYAPKTPISTPNWDKIAIGKIRHGVACEFIRKGEELTPATVVKINNWTNFIMTGQLLQTTQRVEKTPYQEEPAYEETPDELRVENIPF